MNEQLCRCGHPKSEHVQHRDMVVGVDDKRELCLECPGYVLETDGGEIDGYPVGKAWHRFRADDPP